MGDGGGDVVLVPADAFVVDRIFEAVLIVVEAGVTAHPQRVLDNGGGPIDTGIPG